MTVFILTVVLGWALHSAKHVHTHFSLVLITTQRALSPATLPFSVATGVFLLFLDHFKLLLAWGLGVCYSLVLGCSLHPPTFPPS